MSVLKKRNWKTFELNEADLADFATMGGLEIDVLSDDSNSIYRTSKEKPDPSSVALKPKKKKKKATKSTAVEVQAETESSTAISEVLDMSEWTRFGLHSTIVKGLSGLCFAKPSPIQSAVIERSVAGFDVLAAAQTGSGKTLAFGLPILHAILSSKEDSTEPGVRALCILPTRELALQVKKHLEAVTGSEVSVGAAVGGMSVEKQLRILDKKPDIVVGTPGRMAGLLGLSKSKEASQISESLKESLCMKLSHFVLDEADRLLEESHFRDLTEIMRFIYASIPSVDALQSFIFSATLPVEADQLKKLMKRVRIKDAEQRIIVDLVKNETPNNSSSLVTPVGLSFKTVFATSEEDREPVLLFYMMKNIMSSAELKSKKIIVFVNAISYVYRLASLLPLCLPAAKVVGIHSNLRQKDRLKKLDQFVSNKCSIMIATDLAARGLDLPAVDAVVHLQPPRTPESLIHRSGRTARAGKHGECAMIITPKMASQWNKSLKLALGKDITDIEPIHISSADLRYVRSIQRLASTAEGQSHKQRRETKEKAWTKKTCAEADLWDSDASDADVLSLDDDEVGLETQSHAKDLQQLTELLKNRLPSLVL